MNGSWVDIAIGIVVILSMMTGLFRGFVKESLALCIWAFAFWIAFKYGSQLDPWVGPYIQDNTLKTIVEFVIVLIICLIVGGIFNMLLGLVLSRSGLSGTDRLFGMAFGFFRGVFIIAVLILGIQIAGLSVDPYIQNSVLYPKFTPLVNQLRSYVPAFIKQVRLYDKTGGSTMSIVRDA